MRARISILTLAGALAGPLALAACATSNPDLAEGDPLEGVNRPIHAFNRTVTREIVAPVARTASDAVDATPDEGRSAGGEVLHRVGNMLNNLSEPKNAINGALQGNVGTVGTAAARFGLNSTVGLLGMVDVADGIGIEQRNEDFGQTLGSWGAPPGPYVVAPLAGPTTARDATGAVVDTVLNPVSLLPGGAAVSVARRGFSTVNSAGDAIEEADAEPEDDPYAAARDRYAERRAAAIANRPAARETAPVEHRGDQPDAAPALAHGPAGSVPVLRTGADEAGADDWRGSSIEIDIYPAPPAQPAGAPANLQPGAGFAQ